MFRIWCKINNFYDYALYRNPRRDDSLYDCLLDSAAQELSVDDKAVFVFVGDANEHHSGWSQSLLLIDMGVMLLICVIL